MYTTNPFSVKLTAYGSTLPGFPAVPGIPQNSPRKAQDLNGPLNADLSTQVVATLFQNTPKLGCFLAQVRVLLEELSD